MIKHRPYTCQYINTLTVNNPCASPPNSESKTTMYGPSNLGLTTSGDSVRGFKELIKRGANASSDYSRVEKDVDVRSGMLSFTAQCGYPPQPKSRFYSGYYMSVPIVPGLKATDLARNDAIMSFIKDVKSGYNSISGGVFIGELNKTLDMIRNPARGLKIGMQNWLQAVQKRTSRYCIARNRTKWKSSCIKRMNVELADLWLEYSFGWSPLISDTIAGAEALNRLLNEEIRYTTVRGSGSSEKGLVTTERATIAGMPGSIFIQTQSVTKQRSRVHIYGAVRAQAQGPTFANAQALAGFKIEEFVPTVWNLLPYSFLVDYFLNVGDVLEATFFDRSSITWASMSTIQDSRTDTTGVLVCPATSGWGGGGSPGSASAINKVFQRAKTVDNLVPTLEISVPGSPAKWTNIAALVASGMDLQKRMSSPPR